MNSAHIGPYAPRQEKKKATGGRCRHAPMFLRVVNLSPMDVFDEAYANRGEAALGRRGRKAKCRTLQNMRSNYERI